MTDYSRGDYADLPAGKTDLENNYTAPDLTAIASNDNSTYAEQTANNEIAIHQYKKTVTSQYTNITWSSKSSLAPSESPVIMEVYNVTGTPAWEELDRDDSTAADTDFDIIYNNLATADYLDSGVITWRVYQAASAAPVTKVIGDNTGDDYSGTAAIYIKEDQPDTNQPGTIFQMSNYSAGVIRKGLLKFTGLSNIPSGATITNVVLSLNGNQTEQIQMDLYLCKRNWVQAEVTWNSYSTGNNWGTAGAANTTSDIVGTSSGTSVWDGSNDCHFGSTSAMIADVQGWVNGSISNYGWVIVGPGSPTGTYFNANSETGTDSARPTLTVEYTV